MFESFINQILFEIIFSLKYNLGIDQPRVNKLFDDFENSWRNQSRKLIERTYREVETQNIAPLQRLILERNEIIRYTLAQYKGRFFNRVDTVLSFGRQTNDIVRRTSLDALRRSFLFGDSEAIDRETIKRALQNASINRDEIFKRSPGLYKRLNKSGITDKQLARVLELKTTLNAAKAEILDAVPLFHKSGKAKFFLRQRNGWRAWDLDAYSNMVAQTTVREAYNSAIGAKASRQGQLVQFNRTGKAYNAKTDPICKKIDGQTYSTKPGGEIVNGVHYEYWRDVLGGTYRTPHPHCKHKLYVKGAPDSEFIDLRERRVTSVTVNGVNI